LVGLLDRRHSSPISSLSGFLSEIYRFPPLLYSSFRDQPSPLLLKCPTVLACLVARPSSLRMAVSRRSATVPSPKRRRFSILLGSPTARGRLLSQPIFFSLLPTLSVFSPRVSVLEFRRFEDSPPCLSAVGMLWRSAESRPTLFRLNGRSVSFLSLFAQDLSSALPLLILLRCLLVVASSSSGVSQKSSSFQHRFSLFVTSSLVFLETSSCSESRLLRGCSLYPLLFLCERFSRFPCARSALLDAAFYVPLVVIARAFLFPP